MIQNKAFTNLTILQKMKQDNSVRLFIRKEQLVVDFQYRTPLSVPVQVSYFCLGKSSSALAEDKAT